MNSLDASPANPAPNKRSALPIILGLAVVAVAIYFIVPMLATNMMLKDEQAKAKAKYDSSIKPEAEPKVEIVVATKKKGADNPGSSSLDPAEFFKSLDKDGNGTLEGNEIRGRVKNQLHAIDKDKDGTVTKEEFAANVRLMPPEEEDE